MGRTTLLIDEEGVFDTFVSLCRLSLSFSLLFWCLDFLKFLFILPHASKNSTFQHTHTREKKRKEERTFSHPTLHTHLLVHTQEDT